MSYTTQITRANPACFVFLIDQSYSMSDALGSDGISQTKSAFVADAINRILQNLVYTAAKSEGIRDYFWISVIGYGASVGPAFTGSLAGNPLVPISEVADNPARVEERTRREPDGAGGTVEVEVKFPVWFDARSDGATPMCQALEIAVQIAQEWTVDHPQSFPPIVINITDGEATDGDPSIVADRLRMTNSEDGNTLLLNLHVSSTRSTPISFPSSTETLPDDPFARLLFSMSSELPSYMMELAHSSGYSVETQARGFVFNGGFEEVVDFLRIGTQPANVR